MVFVRVLRNPICNAWYYLPKTAERKFQEAISMMVTKRTAPICLQETLPEERQEGGEMRGVVI